MTREDLDRLERLTADSPLAMTRAEMTALIALAREALEARETYLVQRGPCAVFCGTRGECEAYVRGAALEGWRLVRERDGEVVT